MERLFSADSEKTVAAKHRFRRSLATPDFARVLGLGQSRELLYQLYSPI
jgi:hypothetical protein